MAINLNKFAIKIAEREGLKKQVNIAQIKEILKITLDLLNEEFQKDAVSVVRLITKRK